MKKIRDGRENITTIIHDLKKSFAESFHEPFPINDKKMEDFLILAARKVKEGYNAFWFKDDETGNKNIKFEEIKIFNKKKISKKYSDFI